jgi:hypothetical protein
MGEPQAIRPALRDLVAGEVRAEMGRRRLPDSDPRWRAWGRVWQTCDDVVEWRCHPLLSAVVEASR